MNSHQAVLTARDLSVALTPLVAMVVFRVWIGSGGPASATAAPEAAPPIAELANYNHVTMTPEEEKLLARIDDLAMEVAPDVFPERLDLEAMIPKLPRAWEPVPEIDDSEEESDLRLVVTSIMEGRQPIAIIDGQARRVGDKVGPGWIIKTISAGKVTIVHQDGRTRDCTIERFGP